MDTLVQALAFVATCIVNWATAVSELLADHPTESAIAVIVIVIAAVALLTALDRV